jgi:hypothetical protein
MRRISFWHFAFGLSALSLLATASGCGDPFGQKAQFTNRVDTLTLYALRGTPIRSHSAYDMYSLSTSRTDTTSGYDFAFDIDSTGRALIYPAGALGLSKDAGLQLIDRAFDAVHSAPETGFSTDTAIAVTQDTVFVARSRVSSVFCVYVAVPRYGKFHVLAIDPSARTITLESLVDLNCGYRSLDPGIPGS